MTDIGFGLIDRRTVILVLITMVLMHLLPGFQIPVDTQNAENLFIGLVLLTGYLYFARTIYRFPVAFIVSVIIGVKLTQLQLFYESKEPPLPPEFFGSDEPIEKPQSFNSSVFMKRLKTILKRIAILVITPISYLLNLLTLIFTFGKWVEDGHSVAYEMPEPIEKFYFKNENRINGIFGILDRIGLVIITIIATVPHFNNFVKTIGIGGLLAMVLIFTLRGDFTAVVKDIIEKKEKDEEKLESAIEVKNFRSAPMYVEIVNSNENPIGIYNSKSNPLSIDTGYGTNPLPVAIQTSPMYPLDVRVSALFPLPVEVTNVVTTQQDDD
jgi:hypothetical protein